MSTVRKMANHVYIKLAVNVCFNLNLTNEFIKVISLVKFLDIRRHILLIYRSLKPLSNRNRVFQMSGIFDQIYSFSFCYSYQSQE